MQKLFANNSIDREDHFLSVESQRALTQATLTLLYSLGFFLLIFWQCYQKNFFNVELYQGVYFLFLMAAASVLLYIYQPQTSKYVLYFQVFVLAAFSILFVSSHSLFLILSIILIFLSGFSHGFQFCLGIAVLLSAAMNISILLLSPVAGQILWTPVIIYDGSLLIAGIVAGYLSDELRGVAAQLTTARDEVRSLKDLSETMIEKMASAVIAVSASGKILRANPEAQNIFEVSDFEDLYVSDLNEELWGKLKDRKYNSELFELESVSGSGLLMNLECYVLNLDDTSGGWLVFLQNRTKIKNMEERLRQNEKLAAIGQLAAGIAHEIRNPLASISGSIQLLAGSISAESKEDKKLLAIVIKEIDRLDGLISEFMEYVRPDSSHKQKMNLSQLLEDCIIYLKKNPAAADVNVDMNIEKDVYINAVQGKVQQAVLNILINSCQAMDVSTVKKLSVKLISGDGYADLFIQDTGKGIPRDQIRKIFQPFHTTKPKGTGLGLAITHKILESHNADVEVESHVGEGTLFHIKFNLNKV